MLAFFLRSKILYLYLLELLLKATLQKNAPEKRKLDIDYANNLTDSLTLQTRTHTQPDRQTARQTDRQTDKHTGNT